MASTEEIVQQLIGSILANPQTAQTVVEHPYSAVREASGTQDVSQDQVAQVISLLGGLAKGKTIDYSKVEDKAAEQLAANNGSAHTMAESILGSLFDFGAAETKTAATATSNSSSLGMDILGNLANVAFASGKAGAKVDLSDGIGIDDIIGIANIAGSLMGKK